MNLVPANTGAPEEGLAEIRGAEGDILLARQPDVPSLSLDRNERQIFLTWEESDGVQYVPQFTTQLDGSGIWRQVLVPLHLAGTTRRVRLQPYCHARLFRLQPRRSAVRSTPASSPRSISWWRRWLDRWGLKPIGELAPS